MDENHLLSQHMFLVETPDIELFSLALTFVAFMCVGGWELEEWFAETYIYFAFCDALAHILEKPYISP